MVPQHYYSSCTRKYDERLYAVRSDFRFSSLSIMGAERRPVNVERKGERDECSWRLQRGLMNYLLRYSSGRFRCFKVDKRIKPFFLFSFFPSRRKYRTPTPCRGLRNANVLDIRISVLRRRFGIFFFSLILRDSQILYEFLYAAYLCITVSWRSVYYAHV